MKTGMGSLDVPNPFDASLLQAHVERQWQRLAQRSRQLALAYVGAWGFAYDKTRDLYDGGTRLWTDAERKGEQIETFFSERVLSLETRATDEVKRFQGSLEVSGQQLRQNVFESHAGISEELERQIELAVANLGIPSRDQLERLNAEIEELNRRIDAELERQRAVAHQPA
ncbi:MAG: hypothetical protein IPK16_01830 [Anaerolineales bacterium]|nr:hypothetical protein [Anaerolineales bacterium]